MQTKTIVRRLDELKMTQSELAERVGVTDGMISQLIKGKTGLSVQLLKRICEVLDVMPEEVW